MADDTGMASIDNGQPIVFAEPTKTRPGDQQLPNGGRECVQDALIALIEERKQLGIQRYGSPLMTHNGRDSVRDATEEALDLTVYLMQVTMEMRDLRAERDHALARAEHAEEGAQLSSERLAAARAERDRLRARLTGVAIHANRARNCVWPETPVWDALADLFAALEETNDALKAARCPSCDHLAEHHQPEGCWYAVTTGAIDLDLVCPCTVPDTALDGGE